MCLAIVALDAHPDYPLVVAANRDEFHARPAAAAHWWPDRVPGSLLAGRDLVAGGTWLGVTTSGRWAFVTNVREPGRYDPAAPSRGALVVSVLDDPRDALAAVAATHGATHHNGFNLIAGDIARAAWASNRAAAAMLLAPGIHGVSNASLDTPWPKLERVKAGVAAWVRAGSTDATGLFDLLADRARAPDDALPHTGVPLEWERLLAAPFIVSERYGTRCSTVLTVARDGAAVLQERSFDPGGHATGEVRHAFAVATRATTPAVAP